MANIDIKITGENLLNWSNFEDWENGASLAPTNHTLSGASATVARNSSIVKQGTYSAAVTRVGADATLYYDLPDYADYINRKMTFGCWVYATVASRARIAISDGVGSTNSSYHTGVAGWEYLEVSHDIDASATRIRVEMHVNTGNTTAYFDGGVLVDGDDTGLVFSDISAIGKWTNSNRYRGQEFRVARRSGLKIPNMFIESKTLRIEGDIVSTDATTARSNWDALNRAVNTERFKPNSDRYAKDIYLFDDRFLRGFPSGNSPELSSVLKKIDFTFDFMIPDPFFWFVQLLRSSNSISASPTSFNVTVNGSAFSRPIFTITNNGSNVSSIVVSNLTTNQSFSYTGSLVTSESLVVDCDEIDVENDGVDDMSNASGELDMILVPGVNKIKVTGLVSATVKVDWRDRWY